MGAPITSEHYVKWPVIIGEWNLHAEALLYFQVYNMEACIHSLRFVLRSRGSMPFSTVHGCVMRDITSPLLGKTGLTRETVPWKIYRITNGISCMAPSPVKGGD